MKVKCNKAEECNKRFPNRDCGAWNIHDSSQCEPCPFGEPGDAKCVAVIPEHDQQGAMGFDEWIAELIASGMNNKEILTYLDPDTREEDLVALIRTLMTKRDEKDEAPYDSTQDTMEHRKRVFQLVGTVAAELVDRGREHDASKLKDPEKAIFDEFIPKLKHSTYGSEEYKGFLAAMKPALDHHYTHNRHHPEHFESGIHSMNLLDLIEMLADWKAASERHADGNLRESIRVNSGRFNMSGWLTDCLLNTAENLGWWDGVIGPKCERCGSSLNSDGHCVDVTCPFSDRKQGDEYTEG
jgi:hypothetical protein